MCAVGRASAVALRPHSNPLVSTVLYSHFTDEQAEAPEGEIFVPGHTAAQRLSWIGTLFSLTSARTLLITVFYETLHICVIARVWGGRNSFSAPSYAVCRLRTVFTKRVQKAGILLPSQYSPLWPARDREKKTVKWKVSGAGLPRGAAPLRAPV